VVVVNKERSDSAASGGDGQRAAELCARVRVELASRGFRKTRSQPVLLARDKHASARTRSLQKSESKKSQEKGKDSFSPCIKDAVWKPIKLQFEKHEKESIF
jgi:hypothetical protein